MLYKVSFPTGKTLSKTNQMTAEYAKACVAVARECDTQVVDLYSKMMKTPVSFVVVRILMVTSCKDFLIFSLVWTGESVMQSKSQSYARLSMVIKWMGDHYVLGFAFCWDFSRVKFCADSTKVLWMSINQGPLCVFTCKKMTYAH